MPLKYIGSFFVIVVLSLLVLVVLFGVTIHPLDRYPAIAISAIFIPAFLITYLSYVVSKEKKTRKILEGQLVSVEKKARLGGRTGEDNVHTGNDYEITNSISSTLVLLKKTINCHNCILFEASEKKLIFLDSASSSQEIRYEISNESGEGLLGWVAEHRVPLRIDHIRDIKGINYYTSDKAIESLLAVPVFDKKDEVRAVLCVDSREKDKFDHDTERLIAFAAYSMSEFLENIENLRKTRIEASEFTAFYTLSKRLVSALKLDEILDIAITSSKEVVNYDLALFMLKEESEKLKIVAAKGFKADDMIGKIFKPDKSIIGWVIKNSQPLFMSDYDDNKRDSTIFPGISLPIRSLICLPLRVKGDTIGVFLLASEKENFFSPFETKIFEVIAEHTAIQTYNAMMYQQMEKMAATDGLTGIYNHRYFQEMLSREIERAERYNEKISVLLVDIDHFKKVNDTYGHPAGDKILKDVARIIASSIRSIDTAARYGGEEFAVILVNTSSKGALETAERTRKIMENSKFNIGGTNIKITGSIGVAVFPDDARLPDQGGSQRVLISKADSALYLAKKEGRNRAYLFKDVSDRIKK